MIIGYDIIESKAIPFIKGLPFDDLYILIDQAVYDLHVVKLARLLELATSPNHICPIEASEAGKDLRGAECIWRWLNSNRASRHSLILLIGGGALCDLGGFAASCYMRGVRTINFATTLLGMVDACIGGKTAINSYGVKNLIGNFHLPLEVICDVSFIDTLPLDELYSGYGEVIKTALLIDSQMWTKLLEYGDPQGFLPDEWLDVIEQCALFKSRIVTQDLYETSGIRQCLNLGHTIGHALEALSHSHRCHRALLHGEAIAIGLICEMYLSVQLLQAPRQLLYQIVSLARDIYSPFYYTCADYSDLLELMYSDKKSSRNGIGISLLPRLGAMTSLVFVSEERIKEALDFYRETFGG